MTNEEHSNYNRPFVTVIPQGPSKSPRATLLGPPDLRTYTSGSRLKLFAQASDLDGSLNGVQFYINGEPYGDAIAGNLERSSARFPYSLDWEVPALEFTPFSPG